MAIFPGSAIPSAADDAYTIDNSLRFNYSSGDYLSKTLGTPTNNKIWTVSWWMKRATVGVTHTILFADNGGSRGQIHTQGDDLKYYHHSDGTRLQTSQLFRDPSAWYHCVFSFNTTQSAFSDQFRLWVNGERVTDFATSSALTQDAASYINSACLHEIGQSHWNEYFDGYLAEYYFIDGTVYAASDFGELDATTNQWKPLDSDDVKDAVTFGANGFYQKYNSTELAASFTDDSGGFRLTEDVTADYFIVAGGGGGGSRASSAGGAAGGGAGGYRVFTSQSLSSGNYSIVVGSGGAAAPQDGTSRGSSGGDSSFNSYTSTGGGGGGNGNGPGSSGGDGGSGGGGSGAGNGGGSGNTPSTSPSQGNDGGDAQPTSGNNGGGGGGATGSGSNGSGSSGGDGGAGTANTIRTGSSVTYAGGGGGGIYSGSNGSGGSGGGGDGGSNNGTANTGGGAGGASGTGGANSGGVGGSGIVVIRYASDSALATGGTITTYDDGGTTYQVHSFTSSAAPHTITANGDATNQRPQHHDVTANGDAHLIGPKVGTSVSAFDGTGDYLSVPDSTDWDCSSGAYTIEAWVNFGSLGSIQTIVGHGGTGSSSDKDGWILRYDSANTRIEFSPKLDANGIGTSGVTIATNQWYHIAVDRNGSTSTIYVDGISRASGTVTVVDASGGTALRIGTDSDAGRNLTGYLGPLRISNTRRYTADFTPPTSVFVNDSDTKLLIQNGTDGSQTFDDLSTPDHTITANGDVRWFAPKVGAGAMAFDGTGDYLSVPGNVDWDFETSDFTVECWAKLGDITGSNQVFASAGDYDNGGSWAFMWVQSTSKLTFKYYPSASSTDIIAESWSPSTNTWYHVAVVRSGNSWYLWVDGSQVGSTATDSTDLPYSTAELLYLGAQSYNSSVVNPFTGYVDQLRISRLARYTSSFDEPTTAFTDDINTVLLLNADINQGTWAQDTSTGLAISTDSRIKFDGTTDWLESPDSPDWQLGGGTGDFTWESWIYPTETTNEHRWWTQYEDANNRWAFELYLGKMHFYSVSGGSDVADIKETSVNIVQDQWQHVAFVRDGSDAYFYVNGVSKALTTTVAMGTLPEVSGVLYIGRFSSGSSQMYEGYMDEIRYSNSCRYPDGTTFTPQTRGNPFTADSNTKLLIHSDYTGGLGADSSGNYNNFTATNLVATDQMIDTPTNNFATWNPLYPESIAYSEGNLRMAVSGSSAELVTLSTIGLPTSGKWYWEVYVGGVTSGYPASGTFSEDHSLTSYAQNYTCAMRPKPADNTYPYWVIDTSDATIRVNTTAISSGDIFQHFHDADSGKFWMGINGTYYGISGGSTVTVSASDIASGTNPAYTLPAGVLFNAGISTYVNDEYHVANFGADSSFAGNKTAQGNQDGNEKGDFYYEPPSGFLALCEDNLSDPEIKLPGENFNTLIWTGDGATRSMTGLGLAPDFTWIKERSDTQSPTLYDSVRGATEYLASNTTAAEDTLSAGLTSFDSDGWTMGNDLANNGSTETYVGWNWKAGGAPTADNDNTTGAMDANSVALNGSLQAAYTPSGSPSIYPSKMSINTTSGFSIVEYTGHGSTTGTIPHGLGVKPDLIITKYLAGAASWSVYNSPQGATKVIWLDDSSAEGTGITYWRDTEPTTDVFSVGASGTTGGNANPYVAYCFTSIEGYSKVGSYTGNGNADGPFVYLGFRPAFFLYKRIDVAANWRIVDSVTNPYNVVSKFLTADTTDAEGDSAQVDFDSNGVKIRDTINPINVSGGSYLFYAVAESPFKTSNAR